MLVFLEILKILILKKFFLNIKRVLFLNWTSLKFLYLSIVWWIQKWMDNNII